MKAPLRYAPLALATAALVAWLPACSKKSETEQAASDVGFQHISHDSLKYEMARFAPVAIAYDATILSQPEKDALAKLVEAARVIEEIFLRQVWEGNVAMRDELEKLASTESPSQPLARDLQYFFQLNAGPWIRLEENRPFIGTTAKPTGAGYYPTDMTKEEFESFVAAHADQKDEFTSYFTRIERAGDGSLVAVPYSNAYGPQLSDAARLLNEAADILTAETSKPQFPNGVDYATLATFLRSRATAFLSNDYFQSDMDWMDIQHNIIDVTIGPYEVYEDGLFNYKAAFEAIIAIRNPADSKKLDELKSFMPVLERGLPIPNELKNPNRGTDSPISVIDVVHAAGDIKAGVHAIAYNLPNDERVREAKGSKKVLLKNISRAKYEKILVPIAHLVLTPEQMAYVDFESFFNHTLMHELAHGLGPGNITLADGTKTTVNQALKTLYSPRRHHGAVQQWLPGQNRLHHAGAAQAPVHRGAAGAVPVDSLRAARGPRQGHDDPVQLVQGPRRYRARPGDGSLHGRAGEDGFGRRVADARAVSDPGEGKLRRSGRLRRKVGQHSTRGGANRHQVLRHSDRCRPRVRRADVHHGVALA
jgi:hypothetical protein